MKNTKKPDVLIAGFPKSGSTFIYHLLKQHPDIFIPKIKEINYFNKDHFFLTDPEILNPRYFKPFSWYLKHFNSNRKVKIDFSILSSLDHSSAKRVKKRLGDIKIIFILRNKEDFLNSVYNFMKKEGKIYKDYKDYSDFDYFIEPYKREFSRVYIMKLDQLNKNPENELKKLIKFLGVAPYKFNFEISKKKRHETNVYKMRLSQKIKRNVYFFIVKSFYKLISLSVTARLKARGET